MAHKVCNDVMVSIIVKMKSYNSIFDWVIKKHKLNDFKLKNTFTA